MGTTILLINLTIHAEDFQNNLLIPQHITEQTIEVSLEDVMKQSIQSFLSHHSKLDNKLQHYLK